MRLFHFFLFLLFLFCLFSFFLSFCFSFSVVPAPLADKFPSGELPSYLCQISCPRVSASGLSSLNLRWCLCQHHIIPIVEPCNVSSNQVVLDPQRLLFQDVCSFWVSVYPMHFIISLALQKSELRFWFILCAYSLETYIIGFQPHSSLSLCT